MSGRDEGHNKVCACYFPVPRHVVPDICDTCGNYLPEWFLPAYSEGVALRTEDTAISIVTARGVSAAHQKRIDAFTARMTAYRDLVDSLREHDQREEDEHTYQSEVSREIDHYSRR